MVQDIECDAYTRRLPIKYIVHRIRNIHNNSLFIKYNIIIYTAESCNITNHLYDILSQRTCFMAKHGNNDLLSYNILAEVGINYIVKKSELKVIVNFLP